MKGFKPVIMKDTVSAAWLYTISVNFHLTKQSLHRKLNYTILYYTILQSAYNYVSFEVHGARQSRQDFHTQLTSVQSLPATSAEHELCNASVLYLGVCCLYTDHSGLDVQTYYRIPSLYLGSLVVQSPPCTSIPEDYSAVDNLARNNMFNIYLGYK
jgi:hypothetical protein